MYTVTVTATAHDEKSIQESKRTADKSVSFSFGDFVRHHHIDWGSIVDSLCREVEDAYEGIGEEEE